MVPGTPGPIGCFAKFNQDSSLPKKKERKKEKVTTFPMKIPN